MKNFLLLGIMLITIAAISQTRVDGSFSFQTDPNKKYSIYVPSSYQNGTANKVMLALHPWNTSRWDAKSWCDTLVGFAEANSLLLVCPDGGADGQVDDDIDTAFTSVLLDSLATWYTINPDRIFIMGFSWGGLTTYKYGLSNPQVFAGYMPIGAAINGTSSISAILPNSSNKGFYLIHGANDNTSSRYYPLLNALNANSAIVNSKLMPGVGHTIDFPNRNQILTDAFIWLDSVKTFQLNASISIEEDELDIDIYPTVLQNGQTEILVKLPTSFLGTKIQLFDVNGRELSRFEIIQTEMIISAPAQKGVFIMRLGEGSNSRAIRIIRF